MSYSNLVIVESPAKAKTINKYLGSDYKVLASMGHVRDLPSKNGSVDPENDFAMTWDTTYNAKKSLSEIKKAAKKVSTIYLATDPDREGEAISWHISDILKDSKISSDKVMKRVTFNQITKSAVQEAFDHARNLDDDLINAYKARRALDYLVGFNLSPILWRKLPGSRSAGRVQSVALRLICEREREIEKFDPTEYWSVSAEFQTAEKKDFEARLTHYDGDKLKKFSIENEKQATKIVSDAEAQDYTVANIETKQVKRNPSPPFITSTLQRAASSKLYFSASRTMMVAQKLYEGININGETTGLITYMRTDGPTLSGEAISEARNVIQNDFGSEYLPPKPRQYSSKAKNAQEAHEAIRPTALSRSPDSIKKFLSDDQYKLYDLIWKRTLASQMEAAKLDQLAIDISSSDEKIIFRANGSVVAFDGFLKVYFDNDDDDSEDSASKGGPQETFLPAMKEGEQSNLDKLDPQQHFTQPPPRYSEASLVKKMEELGIGRPSTYASILKVLQDRNYVRLDSRRFIPEDRGRIVTEFLQNFFEQYVEYDFTAEMEEKLDDISGGREDWKKMLQGFWKEFSSKVEETKKLRIKEVITVLNKELEDMLFPKRDDGKDRRACPSCDDGKISLKLGKFGAFIGCSNYPECKFTRPLVATEEDEQQAKAAAEGPRTLGTHPDNGQEITIRVGPYGPYVQLEPKEDENKEPEEGKKKKKGRKKKPKRAGLPKGQNLDEVTIEQAVKLLSLPREVGEHPETGDMITAAIGRFGPYLKHQNEFTSIPKDEDVYTIGMNRAVTLIAEKKAKKAKKGKKGSAKSKKSTKSKSSKKKSAKK